MSLSIARTGVISAKGISESLLNPFDPNFRHEPDNTVWMRVSHHNNPGTNLFANTDTFASSVYKSVHLWFNVALCDLATKWELMLIQTPTAGATIEKYRWIQTKSPMVAAYADVAAASITKITTSGYTTPGANFGGLYKANNKSYILCSDGTASDYWCDIGGWTAYQGGIPGYNQKVITTGYLDLYLRIDNLPALGKASIYNDGLSGDAILEV